MSHLPPFSHWSNVVDNEVGKNIKFNTLKRKVNNSEKKIPGATTLIHIINTTQLTRFRETKWTCW